MKKNYRFNHNELDIILICCLPDSGERGKKKISQNRFFSFVFKLFAEVAAKTMAIGRRRTAIKK